MSKDFRNGYHFFSEGERKFSNGEPHNQRTLKGLGKFIVVEKGQHQKEVGTPNSQFKILFNYKQLKKLTSGQQINLIRKAERLRKKASSNNSK